MFRTDHKKSAVIISLLCFLMLLLSCGDYQGGGSSQPGSSSDGEPRVGAEGLVLPTALQISGANDDQSQPDVAYDTLNDVYAVVWSDARNTSFAGLDIYMAIVDPSGTVLLNDKAVDTFATGDQVQPRIAYDNSLGQWRFLVVWTDAANQSIKGRFAKYDKGLNQIAFDPPAAFIISQRASFPEDELILFDVGGKSGPSHTGEYIATANGSATTFQAYPLPGISNVTSAPSVTPGTLLIYEDGNLVGFDDGDGVIVGSRSATTVTDTVGTGDGSKYVFSTILSGDLSPGTLSIYEGATLVATDDGLGKLVDLTSDSRLDTVASSVNYTTKQLTVAFDPPEFVDDEVLATANGVSNSYSKVLLKKPVARGAATPVIIYNGTTACGIDIGTPDNSAFYDICGYLNGPSSSIIYGTGSLTASFTTPPTVLSTLMVDYWAAAKAPAAAVAITAQYTVAGVSSGLFVENAATINYESGYLYFEYTSGNQPGSGVVLTADYGTSINIYSTRPALDENMNPVPYTSGDKIRYVYSSQQSPSVVFNQNTNKFIVAWLDNSNIDMEQVISVGTSVCSNDIDDGFITIEDGTNDADRFYFKAIDGSNTADVNVVRYRNVTLSDATDGDNDLVSDTNDDGVLDKSDGSPIDTIIHRVGGIEISNLETTFTCGGDLQEKRVIVDYELDVFESSPQISYNPITGDPIIAWNHKVRSMSHDYIWARIWGGSNWLPWSYSLEETANDLTTHSQVTVMSRDTNNNTKSLYFSYLNPGEEVDMKRPDMDIDIYNDRLLLVWEGQVASKNEKDIFGHLIDLSSFTPYGSQIDVSIVQYDQSSPRVAYDTVNQRFMVVWEDARNTATNISNMDVYGQFVDPQGQLSGSNSPITTNTSNQIHPSMAFGDTNSRQFLIAWKDGRNPGNADIYGQLWEYSVSPQLAITDGADQTLYNQTLDFGGVDVGFSNTLTFRIWNEGNAPLIINSVTPGANVALASDPSKPFNITNPVPTGLANSINPGSYYELFVRFLPYTAVTYSGPDSAIDIVSNGGASTLYFSGYGIGTDPVITTISLPDAAVGVPYSTTLTGSGGTTPYQWTSSDLPAFLSLGLNTGTITNTTAMPVGTHNFTVQLQDAGGKLALKTFSLYVSNMVITTASLANAPVSQPYSATLGVTGGTSPYTWSITSGGLPAGMTLDSATGVISGTPTQLGSFTFTVQVTDSTPQTATKDLTLIVDSTFTINESTLPDGSEGAAYDYTLTLSGGQPPYVWSISTGNLPPGITLNSATGRLSGTPDAGSKGTYYFKIKVVDDNSVTTQKLFSLRISDVKITTASLPNASTGVLYDQQLSATGGTPGYTWNIASGSLPAGLTLSASGRITGTPTAAFGTYTFLVEATDSTGQSASKEFSIIVTSLSIFQTSIVNGTKGLPYSQILNVTGPVATYTWSYTGSFPPGLTLPSSSVTNSVSITGTPTQTGTYTFTVTVTDASTQSASKEFTMQVISPLDIVTTDPLPSATIGVSYSYTVSAVNGVTPFVWTWSNFPPGLTMQTNGVITGTPSQSGPFTPVITVTDADGDFVSQVFTLNVSNVSITTTVLPVATQNQPYTYDLAATGGVSPYTWAIVTGALPTGLSLTSQGKISGTPTGTAGTYPITVSATDSGTPADTATKSFTLTLTDLTLDTPSPLVNGTKGDAYSATLVVSGGAGAPYIWSYSGTLPPGLTMDLAQTDTDTTITGTPTAAGTYTFTVQVNDNVGVSTSKDYTITVYPKLMIKWPGYPTLPVPAQPYDLPSATTGLSYSYAIGAVNGVAPYTWSIDFGSLPTGLTLASSTGVISGIPSAFGTYEFDVKVTDKVGDTNVATFRINVSDISITTTSPLPSAITGDPYTGVSLQATGGISPYTWSEDGNLAALGLALSTTGAISGTPSASAGTYTFTATVTDSSSPTPQTSSKTFSITITDLKFLTTTLPNAIKGQSYTGGTIDISGGTANYIWSMSGASLPPGLSITSPTATPQTSITGTPTSAGTYTFTVEVTDSSTPAQTQTQSFTLVIESDLQIDDTKLPPNGTVGKTYSFFMNSSGGVPPYTWSMTGGPSGLSIAPLTGYISGTPSAPGTYPTLFTLQDAEGQTDTLLATIKISNITITPDTLPSGVVGDPYTTTSLVAAGGTAPYSWTLTSGSLPAGLTLSAGVISGTPTTPGTSTFTVEVTDSIGDKATKQYTINVSNLKFVTTTLADGFVNNAYSAAIDVTGGTGNHLWAVTVGTLPPGLSITSPTATGSTTISGTPTSAGAYTFTVEVTDSSVPAQVQTSEFTLFIDNDLQIDGTKLPPGGTVGQPYSFFMNSSGGTPPYSWNMTSGPTGLSISPLTGYISGTPSVPGSYPTLFTLTDADGVSDTLLTTIKISNITITPATLPSGVVGDPYTTTSLVASGGTAPYTWSIASGTLPAGLTLAAGVISGTPTTPGTSTFTVQVTDSIGDKATKQYTINVSNLKFVTTALADGFVNNAYTATIDVTGGVGNHTWTVTVGTLPPGLSIASPTGTGSTTISGTPTSAGTYTFTLQVEDSSVPVQVQTSEFTLFIDNDLQIDNTQLPPNGTVGKAYSFFMNSSGGTPPYTWTMTGGPAGLSIVPLTGYISGTPSSPGTYPTLFTLTDADGVSDTLLATIKISNITITPNTLPSGVVGDVYTTTSLVASGGTSPYTWSITSGTLPAGLTLTAGVISGTPTTAGTSTFTVQVTDSVGDKATKQYTINVSNMKFVTTSLADGFLNNAYSATIDVTGGVGNHIWTVTVGSLPPGMSIASPTATGSTTISGTPTSAGSYTFTLQVEDSSVPAQTQTREFTLFVDNDLQIDGAQLPPNGTVGQPYAFFMNSSGGVPPYSWSMTGGPTGLTIASLTGYISGTPSVPGSYPTLFTLTDADGVSDTLLATIKISNISITPDTLPSGVVGEAYATTSLVASGGTSPYTWSITSGALPAGLNLAAGVISGTPTTAGQYTFTVKVTDGIGDTSTKQYTINVSNLKFVTTTLADGFVNNAYSATIDVTGGTGNHTWTIKVGSLPPGLIIASPTATGSTTISGTPTNAGSYSFTIEVTDSSVPAQVQTSEFTLFIDNDLQIDNTQLPPNGTVGKAYSFFMNSTGGTAPYTWTMTGGPTGLSIAPLTGYISGTPSAPGSYPTLFTLTDADGITDSLLATIKISNISITPDTLPSGVVGEAYTTTSLVASGGTSPYTWSITSGALPAGLNLSAGVISGTPTTAGQYTFTVQVTDSVGDKTTKQYTINVSNLKFVTTTLADGFVNNAYSATIDVTGGTGNHTWTIKVGSLPPGLSITSPTATGSTTISGTPTNAGAYSFTIEVTDSSVPAQVQTSEFTLFIDNDLQIDNTQLPPNGTVGKAYSFFMNSSGGVPPYSWSMTGGPTGLSISPLTGYISGTPTSPGSYPTQFTLTDADGVSDTLLATIKISNISITPDTLPSGVVSEAYTTTSLVASGGTSPYTWSITSGALPAGLNLSAGVISGTPTTAGQYTFTVQVTDTVGDKASKQYTINVSNLKFVTTSLADGFLNNAYSATIDVTGGTGNHIWTVTVGSLPPGLSISSPTATGSTTISGTPTNAGSYTFTLQVEDSSVPAQVQTSEFTLFIDNDLQIDSAKLPPGGTVGQPYSFFMNSSGGTPPYSWTMTSGPTGLTISPLTGYISGTPSVPGNYPTLFALTDADGVTDTLLTYIKISNITITPNTLPSGVVGDTYTATTLVASGGTSPYTWSITSGSLPAGLNLTAGIITGTPTTPGTSTFTVEVTDNIGDKATKQYTINVSNLKFVTTTLADGFVNNAYSATIDVTGGVGNHSWAITVGSLPPGISITSPTATGSTTISGTPTSAGTYTFTVEVTDSSVPAEKQTSEFTLFIDNDLQIDAAQLPPDGTVGQPYAFFMNSSGGVPPYTWTMTGGPTGLSIAPLTGYISGTPSVPGSYPTLFTLTDSDGVTDTLLAYIKISNITITPATLPSGVVGDTYTTTSLVASGGTSPYTWSVSSGSLPAGLTLTAGVITGTPTTAGTSTFTVQVTDSVGDKATKQYTLNVSNMKFVTTTLADGFVNNAYSATIDVTGGVGNHIWTVTVGSLPPGISITSPTATGSTTISGTPTSAGSYTFTLQVDDSSVPAQTQTREFTLFIDNDLQIDAAQLPPNGTVGQPYAFFMNSSGGVPPYTWTMTGGPTGLSIAPLTGYISGTPSVPGTYPTIITLKDADGVTDTLLATIKISNITITPNTLPSGVVADAYTTTSLVATGGTPPYSWQLVSGALPTGLSMTAGVISGTPTTAGTSTFTVQVTDSVGDKATKQYTITVSNLKFVTATLADGFVNNAYSATLDVTGGVGNHAWTVTIGTLPPGLSITSPTATGSTTIAGTPTNAGTYTFTIEVADSSVPSQTQTREFTLFIDNDLQIDAAQLPPNGTVGQPYAFFMNSSGGTPPYTWTMTGGPTGLTVASLTGYISGTPSLPGSYPTLFTLKDADGVTDTLLATIKISNILITPATLPSGVVGDVYTTTSLVASGGSSPYTWQLVSGSLPTGLSLTAGIITGTPTTAGTSTFTVQVTDGIGDKATKQYTINVSNMKFVTTALTDGFVNNAYSATIDVTGGVGNHAWTVTVGTLPPGLSITSPTATGSTTISGTPTSAGLYTFTLKVDDSSVPAQTQTREFTLFIDNDLQIDAAQLPPNGTVGKAYSFFMNSSGGVPPYTWTMTGGPTGLTISSLTGYISGTPSLPGSYPTLITLMDADGVTDTVLATIKISNITITPDTLPSGVVGDVYTTTSLVASGGTSPYTWSITSGSLPAGLTLTAGVISGTPTTAGTSTFTVQVTDSVGDKATKQYTINVSNMKFVTTTLVDGFVNNAYSATIDVTGGTGNHTWTVIIGTLPPGLSITSPTATGSTTISGTPTSAGSYTFILQVDDSSVPAQTQTREFTLFIDNDLQIDAAQLPPNGTTGVTYSFFMNSSGGVPPYTWAMTGGPTGLTIAPLTGYISGTPSQPGTYPTLFTLTDADGVSDTLLATIKISNILISPSTLPSGVAGEVYTSTNLIGSGGTAPYTWAVTAGALPPGLTLTTGGTLSGTPTTLGTYTFTVQATDFIGDKASRDYTVTISNLKFTTTSLVSGYRNTAYSDTIDVTGGTGPYTWAVTYGVLPTGITIGTPTATGSTTISGTPIDGGTYDFTLEVSDNTGQMTSQAFSLFIDSDLQIDSAHLPPNGSVGVAYSFFMNSTGGRTPYNWDMANGPTGLSIASLTGHISGTPSAPGVYTPDITLKDADGLIKVIQVTIRISAVTITTSQLLDGEVGQAYSQVLTATGGVQPYAWSVVPLLGTLPPGLTLNATLGEITGTPTAQGTYTFTLQVTDATGDKTTKEFTINVSSLSFVTASLPDGLVNTAYSNTVDVAGGTGPFSWTITSGNLPTGLSLTTSTATGTTTIAGTPTVPGTYTFTIKVTDTSDGSSKSKTFSIFIDSDLQIDLDQLPPNGTVNQPYAFFMNSSGGTSPYNWTMTGGPTGLSIAPLTGYISGTPNTPGSYPTTITLTDSDGVSDSVQVTIRISNIQILTTTLTSAVANKNYSTTFLATGGTTPYTWTLSAGTLPPGLTLTTGGILFGIPTTAGTYPFTIKVTDSIGDSTTKDYSMSVSDLEFLTTILPDGYKDTYYPDTTIQVQGGTPPYTFAISSGAPPSGMQLNSNTGILNGTPANAGNYTFTVLVNDSTTPTAQSASQTFTLFIDSNLQIDEFQLPPNGSVGVPYTFFMNSSGGTPPYTWTMESGPTGLSISSLTGYISGTPSFPGTYYPVFTLSDADGTTDILQITIRISAITISPDVLPDGEVGKNYLQTLTASGGVSPYSWSISAGALPGGLSINATTGVISGAPTASGSYPFTVLVADSLGDTTTKNFTITIASLSIASSLGTSVLTPGVVNTPYVATYTIDVTGGNSSDTFTWNVTSGSIPPGLSLVAATSNWRSVTLNGTPTTAGTYNFTLEAQDDTTLETATGSFSIVISAAAAPTTPTDGGGDGGGETGGGTACYIATAAYGSYLDPHVDALRGFRDRVLMKSAIGRELVQFYYRTSPPVAGFIARHDTARAAMRVVLTPIVFSVEYPLLGFAMVFGSGALGAAWWRRRRRVRDEA